MSGGDIAYLLDDADTQEPGRPGYFPGMVYGRRLSRLREIEHGCSLKPAYFRSQEHYNDWFRLARALHEENASQEAIRLRITELNNSLPVHGPAGPAPAEMIEDGGALVDSDSDVEPELVADGIIAGDAVLDGEDIDGEPEGEVVDEGETASIMSAASERSIAFRR